MEFIHTKAEERYTSEAWKQALDFLWLEVTPKCNLNCVHCYAESSPFNALESKMQYDDWIVTLQSAYNLGCRQMQFIGGEPTIHPDLIRMIIKTKQIGYDFIEVYTNGIAISNKMFQTFVENNVHIAFSVYSYKNQTHDLITNRQGSFEKTIKSIKRALKLDLTVRVGIITMEENVNDERDTIEFLEAVGVKNIGADRIRGIGRGKRTDTELDPMKQLCGACWKGQLVVDAEGNVFPCVFSRFNVIGTISEGFPNLLLKSNLQSFRESVRALNDSKKEQIIHDCDPGGGYCGPDGLDSPNCNPSNCSPACEPSCSPNCSPNCTPCSPYTCSPECNPYCKPECNPYAGCRPK